MRPLIAIPEWDGRIVLAALFVGCYFGLAIWIIKFGGLSGNQKDLALVVLAATSPQLSQIFTSLYRTTLSDERASARRADALKTAIETPSTIMPTALGDQVQNGAEKGARAGVSDGIERAATERTDEEMASLT